MPVYALNVAAEKSILSYISSSMTGSIADVNYYTGVNNEDKLAPAVIVEAQVGDEVHYGTNIYNIHVTTEVKEIGYDTNSGSIGVLAANVFNCFYDPNRKNNFTSSLYGFAVMQVSNPSISTETKDDALINKIAVDVIGCLSGTNF